MWKWLCTGHCVCAYDSCLLSFTKRIMYSSHGRARLGRPERRGAQHEHPGYVGQYKLRVRALQSMSGPSQNM